MAVILDAAEEPLTKFSFPIEKAKTQVDPATGDVIVYGKATDCTVDTDDQIVDARWAAKAVQEWLASGGNVRVQHNPLRDPAGVGIEAHGDGKGGQWVRARIFEPIAKILVLGGALKAFSIGVMRPTVVPDPIAKNGRIIDGILGEISLVDRPANKNCDIEYQLAKRAKDGLPAWVGKMLGNVTPVLTKMGGSIDAATFATLDDGEDVVTVDLPRSAMVTASPASLAKMQTLARQNAVAEKRAFDPGVGGGVDRDQLPESDFGDPANRKYPIVTPGDVEDAGGLIGHAGDPEAVKRRITAIAHRKGPAFVAKLPDAWKTGNEEKSMDEPDVAKAGAKKCPDCGKNFHGDSKLRNCDSCGADLPHADAGDAAEKAAKPADGGDDAKKPADGDDDDGDDPDAGAGDTGDTDNDDLATKADATPAPSIPAPKGKKGRMACAKCGCGMKAKSKFCPSCGTAAVGQPDLAKKAKPTPADGVTGVDADPVPAHREPDGAAVEAFEGDASLPTDPDAAFKTAMRHRGLGVPGDLGVLHDLLCPAFHPAVADAHHPGATLKGIDVYDWQLKAFDAAAGATFEEAEHATKRWQHATTIAGADLETLTELRFEAHHAFKAANPGLGGGVTGGPGNAPTPSTVTPGQFKRPYLADGRARPSFQQEGPNTASVPTGQVSAAQYDRGLLTAGHAADSPANKAAGDYLVAPPVRTGELQTVQYRGALKANTAHAMDVMHYHVAQTFPDLCPMGPDHATADTGPAGGLPAGTVAANGIGKAAKGKRDKAEKAARSATPTVADVAVGGVDVQVQVAEFAKAMMPDLLKAAVTEALAPVTTELAATKAELKAQRRANKRLRKTVDKMAGMANPATAPFRALAQPGALKSLGTPVAYPSSADVAARAQLALQRELEEQKYSDDPRVREAAWAGLNQLEGLRGTR